jgi:hypothetical protein
MCRSITTMGKKSPPNLVQPLQVVPEQPTNSRRRMILHIPEECEEKTSSLEESPSKQSICLQAETQASSCLRQRNGRASRSRLEKTVRFQEGASTIDRDTIPVAPRSYQHRRDNATSDAFNEKQLPDHSSIVYLTPSASSRKNISNRRRRLPPSLLLDSTTFLSGVMDEEPPHTRCRWNA